MQASSLRKVHAWLTAWSEMARSVITRRDQRIRLGIAKRRARAQGKRPDRERSASERSADRARNPGRAAAGGRPDRT
jgi:hypothetical protein